MTVFLSYDLLWLLLAFACCVPAFFVEVCRESLQRYSRKALLGRVPADRRGKVDESLSWKHEYLDNLGVPTFCFRLGAALCLVLGRFLEVDQVRAASSRFSETPFFQIPVGVHAINTAILAVEIVVFTSVVLYFVPAVIARAWAETWLLRFLHVIEWMHHAVEPLRKLGESVARIVTFLFGVREKERSSADIVEEEIRSVVGEGQREGLLQTRDIDMIESIMNYGDLEVSEVMTPRTDMVALDLDDHVDDNLEKVIECGHSRIPVYQGVKDNIVGVLYVKDLQPFLLRGESINLEKIVRAPYFAKEEAKIGGLLQELRAHRQHLAIVRDEHGGTAGLVTLEDIIEEIVGEITDEYESGDPSVKKVSRHVVEVEASMHIDDLNEQLNLSIPEGETYDTIGGFVFEQIGHMPVIGETCLSDGYQLEVIDADDRRIRRLRLRLGGHAVDAKQP